MDAVLLRMARNSRPPCCLPKSPALAVAVFVCDATRLLPTSAPTFGGVATTSRGAELTLMAEPETDLGLKFVLGVLGCASIVLLGSNGDLPTVLMATLGERLALGTLLALGMLLACMDCLDIDMKSEGSVASVKEVGVAVGTAFNC